MLAFHAGNGYVENPRSRVCGTGLVSTKFALALSAMFTVVVAFTTANID